MSYGLVRQVGPWPLTQSDLQKVMVAPSPDPSDYQQIRPFVVRDGDSFLPRSLVADRTVMLPMEIDPRISLPGRRISINRALGARRQPLEGQGAQTALSGGAGLNLKVDVETGRVIDDQFMDQRAKNQADAAEKNKATIAEYNAELKKKIEEWNATPAEKRDMTPGEFAKEIGKFGLGAAQYVLPFLGPAGYIGGQVATELISPYLYDQ